MSKPICVFAFTFLAILPALAQPRGAAVIYGQVWAEGRPSLVHARVRLVRFGIVVDEKPTSGSGQFEFTGIGSGRYSVQVEAAGFEPTTVEASPMESNEMVYLFVDLRRTRQSPGDRSNVVSVAEFLIPKDARREFERAREQQKRSNCPEALAYLEKAVKAYSDYAAAHNEMGNCYVRLGMTDRAEASFKRAIELGTTVYPAMNLADLYVKQGRFDEARNVLLRVIRSNPGEGDAYYSLAVVYFEEGSIGEAETAALQADSRTHRIPDLHLLLAKIYLRKQDGPAVAGQLQMYLDEAPAGPRREEVRRELKRIRGK